jgi:predicted lipoprotein with Yx(FWY)xxD motif
MSVRTLAVAEVALVEHRSLIKEAAMQAVITRISKGRGLPLLVGPAAGFALLAAACGSAGVTGPAYGGGANTGGANGTASSGGNPYGAAPPPAGAASIKVARSGLGSILSDGQGRTLYLFARDSSNAPSCSGACASVWPPLTSATAIRGGTGVVASLLGTAMDAAGQQQVTYNGHPLYYYVGDVNPGATNGEQLDQFGGLWFAVSPTGTQVSQ